jgi:hypothetical protein
MLKGLHQLEKKAAAGLRKLSHHDWEEPEPLPSEIDGPVSFVAMFFQYA